MGNASLVVGDSSESIDVLASDLQVNTSQATVQGVLTSSQIANLPANGQNFLDLAQLEPGIQIQDGQNFDPTKGGYSSISFDGRLPEAPANQVNLGWLRVFDTKLSWTYAVHERVTVKPSVGFYNLFNFANFDLPTSIMSGLLTGTAGTIDGTGPASHNTNRVGVGTGVFTLGSPCEIEFSLKIAF
jgi:hypothetical protein